MTYSHVTTICSDPTSIWRRTQDVPCVPCRFGVSGLVGALVARNGRRFVGVLVGALAAPDRRQIPVAEWVHVRVPMLS